MIARMPLPPSPPIHISGAGYDNDSREVSPYYENGYEYPRIGHRHSDDVRRTPICLENAADKLSRQVFDEASNLPRFKGKDKEAGKRRQISGAASDASSDFEVPFRGDRTGHAYKRRKIDKTAACIADDLERSLEPVSLSAVLKTAARRAKGKLAHREGSLESVSTPKAGRKRPAMKRRPDLGPDDVDLGSYAPSIEGDMTPVMSRPASPAPTVSSVVYEFDEVIPPLKKAKKVDDAGMLKRVKTLEENQRKVWTNIAKRDVSKASVFLYNISDVFDKASGAPLSRYGLSI